VNILNGTGLVKDWNYTGYIRDWSYLTSGAGTLTGSGSSGYIPMWNGTASQNNSVIYQSAGNIGIGTTTPTKKLVVNGTVGGLTVDVATTMPTINTTTNNVTITSAGGSVIVRLG
jgi:hypothetical protein